MTQAKREALKNDMHAVWKSLRTHSASVMDVLHMLIKMVGGVTECTLTFDPFLSVLVHKINT